MTTLFKKITMKGSAIAGAIVLLPYTALAADVGYIPMVTLPGMSPGGTTLAAYAPVLYKTLVGIAIILAVIMLVLGGVKFIGSAGSEKLRGEGKSDIEGALVGLLIIALSWIVLYAINPNFTIINLQFTPSPPVLTTPEEGAVAGVGGASVAAAAGQPWASDAQVRAQFRPVSVKSPTCSTVGQTGCTSVYNIGGSAITGTQSLQSGCGCEVTITGGTEYWLHSTHLPGRAIVDVRDTPQINQYLTGNTNPPANGTRVSRNGGNYTYETTGANANNTAHHWHVVY